MIRSDQATARLVRVLLVALLIILVLAGLRGGLAEHAWAGPYRSDGVAIGAALEIVLAGLLIALVIRRRRAPAAGVLAARLRAALRPVLIAGLIAVPLVLLLDAPLRGRDHRLRPPIQPRPRRTAKLRLRTRPGAAAPSLHISLPGVLYALLVVALIAAIISCVVLLRRRPDSFYPAAEPAGGEPQAGLRRVVESGRAALRELDDARAAIIACYLAMERSLADAGTTRTRADTPDEFLARAVGAGLIRGAAAERLTSLFYEARFSSHELGTAERDAAELALRQLAADLGPARTVAGDRQ